MAGLSLAFPIAANDRTLDANSVWRLEDDYWRFVSARDVDSHVKLWRDDFVGWLCFEWNPAPKGDIRKWVRDIREKRWQLEYQLKALDIQTFGDDTVVVR